MGQDHDMTSPLKGPDQTPMGFEQVVEQLGEIVKRLEQEELPLEASLEAFERGIALARRGQRILDEAERKVEQLSSNGEATPFQAK
jgi:exodeoxyribonuclease VII small subunit